MSGEKQDESRRQFLKTGVASVALLAIAPEKIHAAVLDGDTAGGMNRMVLKGSGAMGMSRLSQGTFDKNKTIYVIQGDFVLETDITMPSGCALQFDGGSISGTKTIKGTNTRLIAGLATIIKGNISFEGTWILDWAYPEWAGGKADDATIDNSVSINYLITQGFPIRIPNNRYYCKTPIMFRNVPFTLDGELEYNGKRINVTFITFYRYGSGTHIALNGKIEGNKDIIDYSKAKNSKLTGVHFRSCNNMQVYIEHQSGTLMLASRSLIMTA